MKPPEFEIIHYREAYCKCPDCGWRFILRKLDESGLVEGPVNCHKCRREFATLIAAIPDTDWRKP